MSDVTGAGVILRQQTDVTACGPGATTTVYVTGRHGGAGGLPVGDHWWHKRIDLSQGRAMFHVFFFCFFFFFSSSFPSSPFEAPHERSLDLYKLKPTAAKTSVFVCLFLLVFMFAWLIGFKLGFFFLRF